MSNIEETIKVRSRVEYDVKKDLNKTEYRIKRDLKEDMDDIKRNIEKNIKNLENKPTCVFITHRREIIPLLDLEINLEKAVMEQNEN